MTTSPIPLQSMCAFLFQSIGGNIMTASPISDLNTLLLACGAEMELMSIGMIFHTLNIHRFFFLLLIYLYTHSCINNLREE